MNEIYDLIIIGGGPGGYSAGIYAARYNLKTLIIAKERGGLVTKTHLIENYPGFKSLSGFDLMQNIEDHVKNYDVPIVDEVIISVKNEKNIFKLKTEGNKEYQAKAIILATGSNRRTLDILGENEFNGKGVSYCATCDGMFFRKKDVCVIGGSDSATKEAIMLSEICNKVYIIYRGNKLRAEPINFNRISKKENVEIIYKTNLKKIKGDKLVNKVILDNKYKGSDEIEVAGVFIEIGQIPNSDIAKQLNVELNEKGEIKVDRNQRTNIKGVYAVGDVTDFAFKQAITAAAQGSIATWSAHADLEK